jgi:NADPH:quinone reductase-like Zn-dependent oxidoreductase
MAPPSEINAVVITKRGTAEVKTVPLPELPDDYILVRTTAVALNPTDWKHVEVGVNVVGTRVGCDYAGIVEQVGPKVNKPFKKGDRICGIVHGANSLRPDGGGFADYIIAKGDLQIKTPDNLSDEGAATLGVAISTVVGTFLSSNPPLSRPNNKLDETMLTPPTGPRSLPDPPAPHPGHHRGRLPQQPASRDPHLRR